LAQTTCAFGDLLEDAPPAAGVDGWPHVEELLSSYVVELKDDRVILSAIHTWVLLEVLDELHSPLPADPRFYDRRLVDVSLAIREVVLSTVGGSARPTERVSLAVALPSPTKSSTGLRAPQR
jgi:hypothetical protein